MKTKENKESNSCEKYYFLIDAFYEINFWPILKELSHYFDFRHFPRFEIFALRQSQTPIDHKIANKDIIVYINTSAYKL